MCKVCDKSAYEACSEDCNCTGCQSDTAASIQNQDEVLAVIEGEDLTSYYDCIESGKHNQSAGGFCDQCWYQDAAEYADEDGGEVKVYPHISELRKAAPITGFALAAEQQAEFRAFISRRTRYSVKGSRF